MTSHMERKESSVRCLTPYSLLTVDGAGTASGGRGRSGHQAQWAAGGPGTGGEGLSVLCVPTQDPSVTAPSGETALLWNLVPPEDRAPSARLRDGWPVWPRTSHCWRMACSCLSWWWALLATARVWPFVSPHCLLAVDWAGFCIPPSSGGRNTWVLSLGKNLGLLVLEKGCEGRRDRCVGLESASQAWDEFLLLSFLCIGRMNCKTNRCLQYNTCIKSNNKIKPDALFLESSSVPFLGKGLCPES